MQYGDLRMGVFLTALHESLKVSGSRRRSNLAIDFIAKALIYATDARNRREKEGTPVRKLSECERLYDTENSPVQD